MRGVPDVAADADPNPDTGFPVVTSNRGGGYTISEHGGTSASAPIWGGIIALADQYAGRHLGFVNPAIYQIARSPHYHQAFHDITAGHTNTAKSHPRNDHRLPSRPGLGPGHRLGQPRRPGSHPAARPVRTGPVTDTPPVRPQIELMAPPSTGIIAPVM